MPTPFIISNPPAKRTENDDVLFENMVDRYIGRLVYTSNGDFVKADYPYARMIMVICQGGGGAGGGSITIDRGGHGGGGGGCAIAWLETTSLFTSCGVIVGTGGIPATTTGGNGTASQFAAFSGVSLQGLGGAGGSNANLEQNGGSGGGTAGAGVQLAFGGGGGAAGSRDINPLRHFGGAGGSSYLGGGGRGVGPVSANRTGEPGTAFGGGGGGCVTRTSAVSGGAGAPGVVIVELYS